MSCTSYVLSPLFSGIILGDDVGLPEVMAALHPLLCQHSIDVHPHCEFDSDSDECGVIHMSNGKDFISLLNGVLSFHLSVSVASHDSLGARQAATKSLSSLITDLTESSALDVERQISCCRSTRPRGQLSDGATVFGFGCIADAKANGYSFSYGITHARRSDLHGNDSLAYVEGPSVGGDIHEYLVLSNHKVLTLADIKAAVRGGGRVFWKNSMYEVKRSIDSVGNEVFNIIYDQGSWNESCTSLTHPDGKTLTGLECDFILPRQ